MIKEKKKRGRGRPRAVDMDDASIIKQVELFGHVAATHAEMADWFETHINTIDNYMVDTEGAFYIAYKKALANTKVSLRRQQIALAQKGNATMLIWLGKQLLGQRDKEMVESAISEFKPVFSEKKIDGDSDD